MERHNARAVSFGSAIATKRSAASHLRRRRRRGPRNLAVVSCTSGLGMGAVVKSLGLHHRWIPTCSLCFPERIDFNLWSIRMAKLAVRLVH